MSKKDIFKLGVLKLAFSLSSKTNIFALLKLWLVRCEEEPRNKDHHRQILTDMLKEYQERMLEFPADLEQLGADMARSLSSDGND